MNKIPLLFSDIFGCDSDNDLDGKATYQLHTTRDREFTVIRTSIKGLAAVEDVTVDWTQPVVGQGLGGILNWEAKQNG